MTSQMNKVIFLVRRPQFLTGLCLLGGLIIGIALFAGFFSKGASADLRVHEAAGSSTRWLAGNRPDYIPHSLSGGASCPLLAQAHPLLADSWRLWFLNRTRMIQLAAVCLVVSIFLLTRGRWR